MPQLYLLVAANTLFFGCTIFWRYHFIADLFTATCFGAIWL